MMTAGDQAAGETRALRPNEENDEPISTMATDCESKFSESLRHMESNGGEKYAEILRKLQDKFADWTAYLGVFAEGNASLDQRLKRHPQYRHLVLLGLDMLSMNLVQTTVDPGDTGSDESSDDDVDRRKVELSCIQKSINELDRLAIYIRQSSMSSLDARVKAFGARKVAEISSFETIAMLAVNGLYPEASESLRQYLSKSMTERYTRLLYWKSHDKKLRADCCRRHGQPRDDLVQTQRKPTPSPAIEPPQRQQSVKDNASAPLKPEASKVSMGTTFLSGTVPSNTGSHLIMPPAGGEMPVRRRTGASTVLRSGAKFPSHPQFGDGEDRKPCPLCRKIFSKADFEDVGWWRNHVNGDLFPFDCVSSTCSESPSFASRSEWTAHTEREHGIFWSRGPCTPNRDKQQAPDRQATSNVGQVADICPLCCLPLDESRDARTGIHQRTVLPATQISNEPPEQLPLDSGEMESKTSSGGGKKVKKSVRFDATKEDSEPAGEGAGRPISNMDAVKADNCGTRKTVNLVMLNHIADHLQFLALLTPRLSTEKLTVGDVQTFSSSQAISSDRAPGKRSTLDDELEHPEGNEVKETDKHGILQENLPPEAGSIPESATPHRVENGPQNEETKAAKPVDWSLYSIPKPTNTEEDTVIERMQKVRAQCNRLLEAAMDNLPDYGLLDLPHKASQALVRMEKKLDLARTRQGNNGADIFIPLPEQEKAIGREDLRDFFDGAFSSIDRGEDDILVDYCTEQVWAARPYQDLQQPTEERFASRRRLFAILLLHKTPSDILRFVKEGVSDLDIPVSASTLRQHLPTWAESDIAVFIQDQRQLLSRDEHTSADTRDGRTPLLGADSYAVAWIATLPIERVAAEAMLDEEHATPTGFTRHQIDANVYTWGRVGEHNIVIASLAAGDYGTTSATTTASSLLASLPSIRISLLVGIGSGIARPDDNRDIRLGDIVVGQPGGVMGGVYQYDLVKAKTGDRHERKGFLIPPPTVLLNALTSIKADHVLEDSKVPYFLQQMLEKNPKMGKRSKQSPGYAHQGFDNDRLFKASSGHVPGPDCRGCDAASEVQRDPRDSADPEIHYGTIASGNTLIKDAAARDRIIADVGEDCICFEIEAAGLMNYFPCLMIRGICDYADSHKNDQWQRYASATAAAYAKELLAYVPAAKVQETKTALEVLQLG